MDSPHSSWDAATLPVEHPLLRSATRRDVPVCRTVKECAQDVPVDVLQGTSKLCGFYLHQLLRGRCLISRLTLVCSYAGVWDSGAGGARGCHRERL